MNWSSRYLWIGTRTCPGCGSFLIRASSLCQSCESFLLRKMEPRVELFEGWIVRSLFQWRPGESDRLSALLVSLKGSFRQESWSFWAKQFVICHGEGLFNNDQILSIAAPQRRVKSLKDHAFFWTEALSERTGLSFEGAPLSKAQSEKQRLKNRNQRAALRLVKKTSFAVQSQASWVLGDDIFTTGETARGVYRALGRPIHFQVWCLARRKETPPLGH